MRAMLRKGLRRILVSEPDRASVPRYRRGFRNAAVIAVASHKGGVGKTTSAVSLATALAAFHNKEVLLVDLDSQGHVAASLKKHVLGSGRPLSRVLLSDDPMEVLDSVQNTDLNGLKVTGADSRLADAESLLSTKIGKEFILRDALSATRTHYDVIIIDCPPNLGNLTLNALVAADWVLAPCDASPLAIQGVEAIVRTMAKIDQRLNRQLDLLGILLTRIDGRNATVNRALDEQLADFQDLVFETRIGINTDVPKVQFAGTSIFENAPDSRAARQYRALADEVARRLGFVQTENAAAA